MPSPQTPAASEPRRPHRLSRRAALAGLAATVVTATAAPAALANAPAPATARRPAHRPTGTPITQADPVLGPHVTVFDPSMPIGDIQATLDAAFRQQETAQFGTGRFAFLFRPGHYQDLDVNIGYYTHVAGLGRSPDDVDITGWVRVEADWFDGNATHNFWRTAENLSVTPWDGYNRFAVSQAAPVRRLHIRGEMPLWNGYDGWASGGFMADSKVDRVVSGSQQQWLTRNSELGEWAGSVWNMVFVGVDGAPPHHFPNPSHTVVDRAPLVKEKPYLYLDDAGEYAVLVPEIRRDARGTSWSGGPTPGTSLPLSAFHVAQEGDTAADLNAALAAGKHLLLTPGVYRVTETLQITHPGTVVLGIGLATLVPEGGINAVKIADVDGVQLAGVLIDAGPGGSETLLEIGDAGTTTRHRDDPIHLHDVFARIGGAGPGSAERSVVVHSHDTLIDHVWLWRGDHGEGVGWDVNPATNGLVVNGDDVTGYGLFVEHYQGHQVIWRGDRGRTYFYQCELPYDPPDQAAWMNGDELGWTAYVVAEDVTEHTAYGLGVYTLMLEDETITTERAIAAPDGAGIDFTSMVIVSLGQLGIINHVINDLGGPAGPGLNDGIFYLPSN
ncbi:adenylyl cyclase [Streptomyces sp. DSM 44915]|uniref:Adenylyl cyclase n=1 Tax=Streptomyces chisholmiae TaxID=3075540 RepID=A0ABU2JR80_9ACTN|nr:adenylyl cyclase [Streptomyces sp. DSM 44915]MDT0267261.1 adenylyl cyclase [Streptomyces sp. DSM 44915]